MRVLLAHNRYRLPGGEERHVDLLEEGLRSAGLDTRRFDRSSAALDNSFVRRLGAGLGLVYRPGGGGIGKVLDEWRPDVVHFHNLWPELTPAALRLAKLRGATVVLTVHNYRFACPGGTLLRNGVLHDNCIEGSSLACALRNPRGSRAESLAYGFALEVQRRLHMLERWVDAFIAPSAFVARMLVRSGLPESRVHVVSYGVPRVEKHVSAGLYGLFVGRLSEEKGVLTLLEATRIASDVPVAVAGTGALAADVRNARVQYLGALDRPSLANALGQAAFTIAPSEWYDNQPFSILEAFAAGKPVISTNLGGLPEIVRDGETGLVVAPHAPEALARAMQSLWHRPELTAELGAGALRLARGEFSLQRQTERIVSLYESVRR